MTDLSKDTAQTVEPRDQLQAAADQARAQGLEQVALAFELFLSNASPADSESSAHSPTD